MGGTLSALDEGFQQGEIRNAAYAWQEQVDTGERVIVGVNKYGMEEPPRTDLLRVDPGLQVAQRQRLAQLREKRDADLAAASLDRLKNAAQTDANLVPVIIECVENECTLGEISEALQSVFGKYVEHVKL